MRIRHATAGTALLVLSVGSLAGCAQPDQAANESNTQALRGTPSSPTSDSPSTTSASPSAGRGSGGSGAGHLDRAGMIRALTVVQRRAGSARVDLRMRGPVVLTARGDVSYAGATPQMAMSMTMPQLGGRRLTMRYVDQVMYMSIPGATPAGTFVTIDPRDTSSPLGKNFSRLPDQMDPMYSFRALTSSLRTVAFVGSARVAGTPTYHYRVSVDTGSLLRSTGQQSVPGMPARLVYQVWLDGRDRVRQLSFAVLGTHTRMRMSRWGVPVHVQAPPASKLVAPGALGRKPA